MLVPIVPIIHRAAAPAIAAVCMTVDKNDQQNDALLPDWDYIAPRAILLAVAIGYGTNFPVGRLMNDALPAAASTSDRFALAALALSPYIPRLRRSLIVPCLLSGILDAVGYCAQSLALVDTPAARVSFLGAFTVVWIPVLSAVFGGRRLGFGSAPQLWIAAALCLAGIGCLELGGLTAGGVSGMAILPGDLWAVVQAIGFGSSFYLIERMMAAKPQDGDDEDAEAQTLPITAVNLACVAAFSAAWALLDGYSVGPFAEASSSGWLLVESSRLASALPGALFMPIGPCILWTGLVTTAAVRVGETTGLGRVAASDAALIVATEPLWASIFGVLLLSEGLEANDLIGGALVVAAPLVSTAEPAAMRRFLGMSE